MRWPLVRPPRFREGLNTVLRNIRQSTVGHAVLEAIDQDANSTVDIQWDQGNTGQVTIAFTGIEQADRQNLQRSYAPNSEIPHQAGHSFSYRGTGGGAAQVVVLIDLTTYSDNRILQVSLAHELVHALRKIAGSSMHRDMGGQADDAWDNFEEFVACAIENVMRSELGLEIRVAHGNLTVDPFFEEVASQSASSTTPQPPRSAGTFQMRGGGTSAAQAMSVARRYVNTIETNHRELARLAEGFAARYRRELELVTQWHQTLISRLTAQPIQRLPFNPFRYL